MIVKKYACLPDWCEPQVIELTFELTPDDLLVAPLGQRHRARRALGGHYYTTVGDKRLPRLAAELMEIVNRIPYVCGHPECFAPGCLAIREAREKLREIYNEPRA